MNNLTLKTLTILSIVLTLFSCGSDDNTISRNRGKVKFETISVTSKIPGRISKIYVTEGQRVKQGDTLAEIEAPEISAKMLGASGAVNAAHAQLKMAYKGATDDQLSQLNESLNAAEAQLKFAKESLKRVNNMYKDSLITRQSFEETEMKYKMAKAKVDGIKAKKREVGKSARKEVIEQAKGNLNMARAARKEAQIALNERYILAPTDMSIETITLKKGELATPGYTLFNGYELNSVYFRFTINESKIYNFKLGQKLIIENPYTNKTTETTIKGINQLARYADISSTSPDYQLTETIYELKCVPNQLDEDKKTWYNNATVIIKD